MDSHHTITSSPFPTCSAITTLTGIEKEIVIEGWGEKAFLALLEWIYTGRVPQDLPVHHMTEVLGLADQYNYFLPWIII